MKKHQIRLAFVAGVAAVAAVSLSAYATVSTIFSANPYAAIEAQAPVAGPSVSAVTAVNTVKAVNDSTSGSGDEISWTEVELSSAGTLGVEVLYKVDKLTDVKYLKVTGAINSTDWSTISQMTGLVGIDLSNAITTEGVPERAFFQRSTLTTCLLPEGVTSIGDRAFNGTSLETITIPASVTLIDDYAFYELPTLKELKFAKGSKLKTINDNAFARCTAFTEVELPEGLTKLNGSCFARTTSLEKLILPSTLTYISDYVFYYTKKLQSVAFPAALETIDYDAFEQSGLKSVVLPLNLKKLGSSAFSYCDSLTYVELPTYISDYNSVFYGCSKIKKVVSHAATPPSIYSDPFSSVTKADVELVVPSFAVVDYKLDSYWYKFGTITASEESQSYYKIASSLSLLNDRRMNGKPDVDVVEGGKMSVGGNSPMTLGTFNINFYYESDYCGYLINNCPSVSADAANSIYKVYSGNWYFITPVHDVLISTVKHSANASFVFRYYDAASRATNGTGSSWKNVTSDTLHAGQGYIFQCNNSGTITLPSTESGIQQLFVADDVTTPVNEYASDETANANWNYVGNPYPCYYDIYYMDFTAPITVWDQSNRTYKALSIADDDYALQPMQAFFVQKPDDVSEIVFHKEGRQFTSDISHASSAKQNRVGAKAGRKVYNLSLSSKGGEDQTRVVINESASLSYELSCDASKFMSLSTDVPQVYTIDASGNSLAINERPAADGRVALGFYAPAAGEYTLYLGSADGTVSIVDAQTEQTVTPADGQYTFSVDAAGTVDNRLTIVFASANPTGIGAISSGAASVKAGQGTIEITAAKATQVRICTMDGKTVVSDHVKAGSKTYQLQAGLYIVDVNGETTKCVVY